MPEAAPFLQSGGLRHDRTGQTKPFVQTWAVAFDCAVLLSDRLMQLLELRCLYVLRLSNRPMPGTAFRIRTAL